MLTVFFVSPSLQNKRYAQALELAKKDKLYKDAMATAATSQVMTAGWCRIRGMGGRARLARVVFDSVRAWVLFVGICACAVLTSEPCRIPS